MARLALCAAGLALVAPFASAEHGPWAPPDNDALVQISREETGSSFDVDTESMELLGGVSEDEVGYAFEKYDEGKLVEGKMPDGEWVPCVIKKLQPGNSWDIHVVAKVPGYNLPGVPAHLLRRHLDEHESDWHVDNSGLQHDGFGVAYRKSKNFKDTSRAYAPFDSLVVGRDEGDGWLKVSQGYLPMQVDGKQVLSERPRSEQRALSREVRDWYVEEEEARRKAAMEKEALQPPPPQQYENSEKVGFRNEHGAWHQAQVTGRGLFPNTYNLLVGPAWGQKYPAFSVPSWQLRKTGPPEHTPIPGESPLCQKQGCIQLRMRTESGKEYKVRAVMGLHIQLLMKSACARMGEPWESCQTRVMLSHNGRKLSPSWRTYEADLKSDAVVDVKLAPETATPVRDVSA